MAIKAWKNFEKTPWWQRRKRFFKRLTGKELRLSIDLSVPLTFAGGWWYNNSELTDNSLVYSLGVGDDIEFDLTLIRDHDLSVHAFDPTPNSEHMLAERELPDNFIFHAYAISDQNSELKFYPRRKRSGEHSTVMYTLLPDPDSEAQAISVPSYTLSTVAAQLKHTNIDLLKIDIEGAEYAVIEGLLASELRPQQILVEFHHRFANIGVEKTRQAVDSLRKAGYKLIAISDIGRELTFLHQPD